MGFYIPTQSFNNSINWEQFRNLSNWKKIIKAFELRIYNYFFEPIELLYKKNYRGRIKFIHNFPISNICWSLLDIFAQLREGGNVGGKKIDNLLVNFDYFFPDVKTVKRILGTKNLYDVFRNKPVHNAMVKGIGGLDHLCPDVFNVRSLTVMEKITGKSYKKNIIIENPIKLYEGIKSYLDDYLGQLKIDIILQQNFKNRIQDLFEIQFTYI